MAAAVVADSPWLFDSTVVAAAAAAAAEGPVHNSALADWMCYHIPDLPVDRNRNLTIQLDSVVDDMLAPDNLHFLNSDRDSLDENSS